MAETQPGRFSQKTLKPIRETVIGVLRKVVAPPDLITNHKTQRLLRHEMISSSGRSITIVEFSRPETRLYALHPSPRLQRANREK